MARELLTPDRLRRSGIFNPEFVQAVLKAQPHQRLRWHYFLLWQMIGVETLARRRSSHGHAVPARYDRVEGA